MAKKQQIRRKFYITLEVDMDQCHDYNESDAQQMLHRIANSVEQNNKKDKYFVQSIKTVSIIDEKGGILWARI